MAGYPAAAFEDSSPPRGGADLPTGRYRRSPQFGGPGGGEFCDCLAETCRLAEVRVRSGSRVDAIQAVWEFSNGTTVAGTRHGGGGGTEHSFRVEKGNPIERIELRSGATIDSLTFYTRDGKKHGPYGGHGGHPHEIAAGPVNGFFGRSGSLLDAFGVLYTPSPP